MAGSSGPRNVNLRYQRARDKRPHNADADAEEGLSNASKQRARSSSSGSRRGRPPLVLQRDVPEEDRHTSDDNQVRATDDEGEAHEGGEAGGSSTASTMARVYLRGPSKLLGPPLPLLRLVI
jgi:hypothetical protein